MQRVDYIESDLGSITLTGTIIGDVTVLPNEPVYTLTCRVLVEFGSEQRIIPMNIRSRDLEIGGYATSFQQSTANKRFIRLTGNLEFNSLGLATLELLAYMTMSPNNVTFEENPMRAARSDFERVVFYSPVIYRGQPNPKPAAETNIPKSAA